MRGCIDCKHHKSDGKWNDDFSKFNMSYTCTIGHIDTVNSWWNDNGHKKEKDDFIAPECAELTDGAKILQGMIDKTIEITELLKNR